MAHPIVYGPVFSTYVWSARLALAEKGVTHELVDVTHDRLGLIEREAVMLEGGDLGKRLP